MHLGISAALITLVNILAVEYQDAVVPNAESVADLVVGCREVVWMILWFRAMRRARKLRYRSTSSRVEENRFPMNLPFRRNRMGQLTREHFQHDWFIFSLHRRLGSGIFHFVEMKDRQVAQLTASRQQLLEQMPDLSTILPGSLLSRMMRCNKPGCRFCEKGKGPGHGPIWILSVSLGHRQVRQIPIPKELKKEVEESLRAFAQMQRVLKQIAQVNLELFKERKRQRP